MQKLAIDKPVILFSTTLHHVFEGQYRTVKHAQLGIQGIFGLLKRPGDASTDSMIKTSNVRADESCRVMPCNPFLSHWLRGNSRKDLGSTVVHGTYSYHTTVSEAEGSASGVSRM